MFHVGQKVICIDNLPGVNNVIKPGTQLPRLNKIYTIREIYITRFSEIALILVEVVNQPDPILKRELGFRSSRFRSIDDSYKFADDILRVLEEELVK